MHPKIFVIIVTYNGSKWIDSCFPSLRTSTIPLHVLVIDNGSSDNTLSILKSQFPEVQIIQSPNNLGFGKANNIGIEKAYNAGADFFFLLNQDAWIEPDTIEKLIFAHSEQPTFGVVSPMHLNGAGDALDFLFSTYITPSGCKGIYSDIYLGKAKGTYEVSFVNAAAWMISRETVERIGGFSPSFFHYGEDDNYLQRLRFHKLLAGIVPLSRIYHDRENRGVNKFSSESEIYKRAIILRSSNPNTEFSFIGEYFSIIKQIIRTGLKLDYREFLNEVNKIKILSSLDKKSISEIREVSRHSPSAFLSLDSPLVNDSKTSKNN